MMYSPQTAAVGSNASHMNKLCGAARLVLKFVIPTDAKSLKSETKTRKSLHSVVSVVCKLEFTFPGGQTIGQTDKHRCRVVALP